MCIIHSTLRTSAKYNYDGDRIVPGPIIPDSRTVPLLGTGYELDVRELLLTERNAVIRRTIDAIRDRLPSEQRERFLHNTSGNFDFRAGVVREYVERHIRFSRRKNTVGKTWLFPDETIALGEGDCEDRAILYVALCKAAGISSYVLRVALGKIVDPTTRREHDHSWAMYKNERGVWETIELQYRTSTAPSGNIAAAPGKARVAQPPEYTPFFVFNTDHLWEVRGSTSISSTFEGYLGNRRFWAKFDPTFGLGTHASIFSSAVSTSAFAAKLTPRARTSIFCLKGIPSRQDLLSEFCKKVARVDLTLDYEQRHHFDNSRIGDAAALLEHNLADGSVDRFAEACHAVADFYAHSSYAEFARIIDEKGNIATADFGNKAPYRISPKCFRTPPDYSSGPYDFRNFDVNAQLYQDPASPFQAPDPATVWAGRVVSGRFGQRADTHGLLERTQWADDSLVDYWKSAGAPHHEDMAVDGPLMPDTHKAYKTPAQYRKSYEIRLDAAIRHTRQLFDRWRPA